MENSETRIEREVEATNRQHTGNHEGDGPDRFGGTRAGAGHVERAPESVQKATDLARVAPLDERLDEDVSVNGPAEQAAERDERGRL